MLLDSAYDHSVASQGRGALYTHQYINNTASLEMAIERTIITSSIFAKTFSLGLNMSTPARMCISYDCLCYNKTISIKLRVVLQKTSLLKAHQLHNLFQAVCRERRLGFWRFTFYCE